MARSKVLPGPTDGECVPVGELEPPALQSSTSEDDEPAPPPVKVDVGVLGVQSEQVTERMVRALPALAKYEPGRCVVIVTDSEDDVEEVVQAEAPGCRERCAMRGHNCKLGTQHCLRKTAYYCCFVWLLLWLRQRLDYLWVDLMYGPLRTQAELMYAAAAARWHACMRRMPDFIQQISDPETGWYARAKRWLIKDVVGCWCWMGRSFKDWLKSSQYKNSG